MRIGNVVLLLFGLIAAGGVGFYIGSSRVPASEKTPDKATNVGNEDRKRPAPPSPDAPTLIDAIAAIPIPEFEPGDGEITGVVRLENAEALEGVLVRATCLRRPIPVASLGGPPADPDLEDAVRDLVLDRHHQTATRAEARTGPDGTFRLTGLANARYTVQAYLAGHRIYTTSGWQAWPGGRVDFKARAVAVLSFAVLDPDGGEAVEARVEARASGGGTSSTMWSGMRRTLELNPGTYTLTALANSGEWKSAPVEVEVAVGAEPREITLRMRPVPGIRGRIVFPDGEPARHLTVYVLRWPAGEMPLTQDLWRLGKRSDLWTSDSYSYVFPDLKPGKWMVVLTDGNRIVDSARVTISDEMLILNLTVPVPDPSEHIVVSVTGPDGEPIENAQISTGIRHRRGRSSGGGQMVRLGAGRYRVRHHDFEEDRDYEDLTFFLAISAAGYGQKEVRYDPERTGDLTVTFQAPATLRILVPNAPEGWLGSRLTVGVSKEGDRFSSSSTQMKTVDSTTAECGPVAPGEYSVTLFLRHGSHTIIPIARSVVNASSGQQEHEIRVPPLYGVTIVMDDAAKGTRVGVSPVDRRTSHWNLILNAKDGRVTVSNLPAGTYNIRGYGVRSGRPMQITLPGPAEVHFAPTILNAAKVFIADPAGVLGSAGFRDGDVIIGADGKLFEDEAQLGTVLRNRALKNPGRLLVLRGGSRIELTADLQKLFETHDQSALGGSIEMLPRPK